MRWRARRSGLDCASECVGNDADVPKAMPGSHATVPVTDDQVMSAARFAVDARHEVIFDGGQSVRRIRIPTRAQPLYFARTQGSRPKLCS
jgi:hypothetical protein